MKYKFDNKLTNKHKYNYFFVVLWNIKVRF